MAGTRKHITRWRRVKHVAMVLCVQCALAWVVLCGISARLTLAGGDSIEVAGASMMYARLSEAMRAAHAEQPAANPFFADNQLVGQVQWQRPLLVPAWDDPNAFNGPGWSMWSWELTVPLWPVPVAFGAMTWYAGRRIKRLQRHGCDKCGYDTRGLAACTPCPECGTTCSV